MKLKAKCNFSNFEQMCEKKVTDVLKNDFWAYIVPKNFVGELFLVINEAC